VAELNHIDLASNAGAKYNNCGCIEIEFKVLNGCSSFGHHLVVLNTFDFAHGSAPAKMLGCLLDDQDDLLQSSSLELFERQLSALRDQDIWRGAIQ